MPRERSPLVCAIHRIGLVAILCLPLTSVSCMPGQRLLTIQIEAADSVVFEGSSGVPDSTPVAEMWDVLGDVRFEPSAMESGSAKQGTKNPRVIEGNVVVRIMHVNVRLAQASLSGLTLHYDDGEDAWRLQRTEVDRLKAAVEP